MEIYFNESNDFIDERVMTEEKNKITKRNLEKKENIKVKDMNKLVNLDKVNKISKGDIKSAKRTLAIIASDIMTNKDKINQSMCTNISNIISSNLIDTWTSFKHLHISLNNNAQFDMEFILPKITSEFINNFIDGKITFDEFIHNDDTIKIVVSKSLFEKIDNANDIFDLFKNAAKYYDVKLNKCADKLFHGIQSSGVVFKKLLSSTKLMSLITTTLSLFTTFEDVSINETFNDMKINDDAKLAVDGFFKKISQGYHDKENKNKIINDINDLMNMVKKGTYDENTLMILSLHDEIKKFYEGDYNLLISSICNDIRNDNCEIKRILTESKTITRKLNKIPMNIVAYILIEGESIKDSNDKQLIIGYAYSKLEIVDWYIELLNVGSRVGNITYIVPHSKQYLEQMRVQLLSAIKKVMDIKIPSPNQPLISINYPIGYEG